MRTQIVCKHDSSWKAKRRSRPTPAQYRRKVLFAKANCTNDVNIEACSVVWTDILEMTKFFYKNGELYHIFDDYDETMF